MNTTDFTPQNGAILHTDPVRTNEYLQNLETPINNLPCYIYVFKKVGEYLQALVIEIFVLLDIRI